jgi:hypothetical protein
MYWFILTIECLFEMSHQMVEDKGGDLSYAKTCIMIVSC